MGYDALGGVEALDGQSQLSTCLDKVVNGTKELQFLFLVQQCLGYDTAFIQ